MRQRELIAGREVIFESEVDGGFHVSCPELKGCHSYGATRPEARANIEEAIALWLESAGELGFAVPAPRPN